MCNLYRMSKSQDEVADFFRAIAQDLAPAPPGNAPEEIYPGYPACVFTGRSLEQMVWGFPLPRKGAKGQPLKPKPVNNARADRLSSPFWASSFRDRRCLIPVSEFAEAEGPRGAKTRTWFALPDSELFAVAGLWRPSAEWGKAFTMVMTEACQHVAGVHDRMPVIVQARDWPRWLRAEPQDALALCRPWEHPLSVRRSNTPWAGKP